MSKNSFGWNGWISVRSTINIVLRNKTVRKYLIILKETETHKGRKYTPVGFFMYISYTTDLSCLTLCYF